MLRKFIILLIALLIALTGLILINYSLPYLSEYLGFELRGDAIFGLSLAHLILGAAGVVISLWLAMVLAPVITDILFAFGERVSGTLSKTPTSAILVVVFGIAAGLVLANLMGAPFSHLPLVGPFVPIVLSLIFSVVGAQLALRRQGDIVSFFNRLSVKRPEHRQGGALLDGPLGDRLYSSNKLLDSSVIIDGRVMDIIGAGFLEGKLVLPGFVLQELQRLSDSADGLKRAKGRRGLDLIHDLQSSYQQQVVVVEKDYDDIPDVDSKLVRLAKEASCVIMTNDYNLNKVAEIQGVQVLNVNELANAIKPILSNGDLVSVYLVKEGKEYGQAVAYLEDGTMIVVDGGRRYIGSRVDVVVTSVLQTAAGRLIFAKMSRR